MAKETLTARCARLEADIGHLEIRLVTVSQALTSTRARLKEAIRDRDELRIALAETLVYLPHGEQTRWLMMLEKMSELPPDAVG